VRARLAVLLVAGALALTACGGGGGGTVSQQSQALGNTDVNPQPRDKVRNGGDLRLPFDVFPGNFNYNELDGSSGSLGQVTDATLPQPFIATADGGQVLDPDYVTAASVTSTKPQVVTYTINPKATWSDGTPITWRDFQAYWHSLNGTDPAYQVAGTVGYDDISSVTRGSDDRQVLVTFTQPFGEWRGLFSPLTPASLNSNPAAFNSAWQTRLPVTSGPFTVQSIDLTSKTVTLARDPKWWGTPAKLDHIIFKVYDTAAEPDALANNELDYYPVNADLDLFRRAQRIPGAVVRNAPSRITDNLTLNGSAGSPLADLALRQAVAQSIDRQEIVRRTISQIVPNAVPDGSHLYPPGSKEYQDNAGALPYDPAHAQQVLDSVGWVRQGGGPNAVRTKNGQPLTLRLIYGQGSTTGDNVAKTVQNQLAQIGVTVVLNKVDQNQLFPNFIDRGAFDLALFAWESVPGPFSSSINIYGRPLGDNVRQNYGRVGSSQIDALFAQGNAELDDTRRAAIGNQVDRLIWQQAHSVIFYARPGAVAERSTLANFGAKGFAQTDYIDAGFVQ
jgi:peptide/nickel transport system substrate-binding protein